MNQDKVSLPQGQAKEEQTFPRSFCGVKSQFYYKMEWSPRVWITIGKYTTGMTPFSALPSFVMKNFNGIARGNWVADKGGTG